MDDSKMIDIPFKGDFSLKIRAPHLAAYRRWSYTDSIDFYLEPITKALNATGLLPLPEKLAKRVGDSVQKVRLVKGTAYEDYFNSERKNSEHWLRKKMEYLSQGIVPEFLGDDIDCLFRKVFTPEDFSLDQKVKLFDYFVGEVISKATNDYVEKLKNDCSVKFPIYLVSENCTLKEWKESRSERVNSALKGWLEAQKSIHSLADYSWTPLDFIFGNNLQMLIQLKSAALNAELKESYDTVMREYHDFLAAVDQASQIGAMRANTIHLDSMLLGKYRVSLYIRDTGKGAALAKDVNYHVVEPVKEVASIFASTFKFIFGGK